MGLHIRDVIDLPATKPPLVVKVGEINDEERKAFHAQEYVITATVAEGLRRVVTSIAESADKGYPGQGIWVSGSFGTGKSHFLSFAGMLLRGEPAAWAREVPGLVAEGSTSPRAILKKCPVFVVPPIAWTGRTISAWACMTPSPGSWRARACLWSSWPTLIASLPGSRVWPLPPGPMADPVRPQPGRGVRAGVPGPQSVARRARAPGPRDRRPHRPAG